MTVLNAVLKKNNKSVRPVKGYSKVVMGRSANTLWRSSKVDVNGDVRHYQYLRFYPDGTVIGVSATGTPTKRWFKKPYENTGTYSLVGSRIKLSLTSSSGTVDCQGRIVRQVLTLNVHSHINGNRSRIKYAPLRKARLQGRSSQGTGDGRKPIILLKQPTHIAT